VTALVLGLLALGLAVPVYAYVGYPLLLALFGSRGGLGRAAPDEWPPITIILPAYNEAAVIASTLDAILDADYPADRRRIVVISDASTDGTDEIVRGLADRGVELVRLPARGGKTAAENVAAQHVSTDIVVNTDASVRLHPQALKPLVAAFADPSVGIASGRDVSVGSSASAANVGESSYVGYEMWIRDLETRAGGIVGASGCFFASRRELQGEIVPEALSRDFAAPLVAREHGFRAVSVRDAVCYVPRAGSLRREYWRKVRTMTRGLQTLYYKRHLLNPRRYGRFAWMLWSHKLVRWLLPFAAVVGVAAGVLLGVDWPAARPWLAAGGAAVGLLAAAAWWWPGGTPPRLVAVPGYLVWGIVAALHAWINAVRGDVNPTWEPTRRDPVPVR
jgi:cellulose synthase/poly-beta-1,6-N-acetylglucosamine synthase-like glycosyltransferase